MRISKIHYTPRFIKDFKKLSKDKQKLAAKRENLFRNDPFTASLKTHKLTGKLEGLWAFSLTYHDRVLFKFINKTEAIFFKIGSHAIYDR
ncbi:MAG: type II toxin-antitoxin system YafQ family toxin [Patescibacteria group bacterium]